MAEGGKSKKGSESGGTGQHPGTSVGLMSPIDLQTARLDALIDCVDTMLKAQIAAAEKCLLTVAALRADPKHPPDKKKVEAGKEK